MAGHTRSRPSIPSPPMSTSPPVTTSPIADKMRSHWSEEDDTARPLANLGRKTTQKSTYSSLRSVSGSTYSSSRTDAAHGHLSSRATASGVRAQRPIPAPDPIITISTATTNAASKNGLSSADTSRDSANSSYPAGTGDDPQDEPDYVTVEHPTQAEANQVIARDKASRVLGIRHRRSMEPIPASNRASVASVRSAPAPDNAPAPATSSASGPTLPLASLYVVSGLPKSPHTWTLADPDSVLGLHHSDGAVSRWWRPEVLGSTVSPGAGGGGKKKRKGKLDDASNVFSSSGHLSKQEVGKMLSKALKVRPVSHLRGEINVLTP